jgi:hypothetical protein
MQFACANPWLLQSPLSYKTNHDLVLPKLMLRTVPLLVIRLPTDAVMAAGRRDAQAFDLALLDDLPKGFFGILIPYSFLITSSIASNKRAFSLASLS